MSEGKIIIKLDKYLKDNNKDNYEFAFLEIEKILDF